LDDADFEWVDTGEVWPDSGKPKKKKVAKSDKKTLKEGNWKNMPHVMLSKCAEAQALRRGWPEAMSGLYVQEEMDKVYIDMTSSEAADAHERDERLKRVAGTQTVPVIFELSNGIQLVPTGQFADRVLEHLRTFADAPAVEFWKEQNTLALKQFWAYCPSEAHELKKSVEKLTDNLKKPNAA
jgi:hypothetical protein